MADARFVVGDPVTSRYEVRHPATGVLTDATTTLAVTLPDGSALSPDPTPTSTSTGVYLGTWTGTVDGLWRWTWTATGAVQDKSVGAVYVWPLATALPWVPTRRAVAALVPTRTVGQDGTDPVLTGTFTEATSPTAVQVDEILSQSVAWVAMRTGTVDTSLYEAARSVAAMRAAGMVLTAYPLGDAEADTDAARRWLDLAGVDLAALVAANTATGTDDGPGTPTVGAYSFPSAPSWGDSYL